MLSQHARLGGLLAAVGISLASSAMPIILVNDNPRRSQSIRRRYDSWRGCNNEPKLADRIGTRAAERYRLRILAGNIPRNQILFKAA